VESTTLINKLFADGDWGKIFSVGLQLGISFYLIGGAVRDFIVDSSRISSDLDFEIHLVEQIDFIKILELFIKQLRDAQFEVDILAFSIVRVTTYQRTYEFALPRQEYFAQQECYGHSDFKFKLFSKLDPAESFKRRDFSCNAIAVKVLNSHIGELVDPFDGVKAITAKQLVPCSPHFFLDPVRFLR
jgi:tRNA nucleotidyltransferase/poly(A) polymerase